MLVDKVRRGLFKDETLENELFQFGFIKIPFFEEAEMEQLKQFYYNVHPEEKLNLQGTLNGIHMTTWSGNTGYKMLVGNYIKHIFSKACDRVFQNHRHLNHVFIVKESGSKTEFNIHQDWSVVDEAKDYSVNIWVPLHDVTKDSGALWILPGSHRLDQPIRGAGCLFPDYMKEMDLIRDKVRCIEVKLGEALIFFHCTIHGSPPNVSDKRRVVSCCSVIREDAELTTYFQRSPTSQLQVYRPEDDFMYNYNDIMNESTVKPPLGKLIEERESYELNRIDSSVLLNLCEAACD